jgi:hypothetical protein
VHKLNISSCNGIVNITALAKVHTLIRWAVWVNATFWSWVYMHICIYIYVYVFIYVYTNVFYIYINNCILK